MFVMHCQTLSKAFLITFLFKVSRNFCAQFVLIFIIFLACILSKTVCVLGLCIKYSRKQHVSNTHNYITLSYDVDNVIFIAVGRGTAHCALYA